MDHVSKYFKQVAEISQRLDQTQVEGAVAGLAALRERGGRLFLLGVGGSAANCAHAVNDFRKLCDIEAYAPTDNVSELTARTNDEGWETVFSGWLRTSRISKADGVFIFSVGGGDAERNVSVNLIRALDLAVEVGATIFGVVGRNGGYTARVGQHVVIIPTVDDSLITPHTEAYQAVVWHCFVSHPSLQRKSTKW
jgi:D-sedoheptulose 7-phosphate isomerase